jgi:hypothetical protein
VRFVLIHVECVEGGEQGRRLFATASAAIVAVVAVSTLRRAGIGNVLTRLMRRRQLRLWLLMVRMLLIRLIRITALINDRFGHR